MVQNLCISVYMYIAQKTSFNLGNTTPKIAAVRRKYHKNELFMHECYLSWSFIGGSIETPRMLGRRTVVFGNKVKRRCKTLSIQGATVYRHALECHLGKRDFILRVDHKTSSLTIQAFYDTHVGKSLCRRNKAFVRGAFILINQIYLHVCIHAYQTCRNISKIYQYLKNLLITG